MLLRPLVSPRGPWGGLRVERQTHLGCGTSMQGPSFSQPPSPVLSALSPAAMFAFSPPHSGGHQTQCNIQPRVGKSWRVLRDRTGEVCYPPG